MNYKKASLEEIEEIYKTHMKKDFPPAELKPLSAIKYSVQKGWYVMYIAYDEKGIKGYACIADCGGKIGFLDYFAIVKEYRGTGVGTEFFAKLKSLGFECIILETESVESAKNEEEDFIRKRRIAFYKRSGCVDTGCMYNVFGVEYNVFINKDIELTEDFLAKLLSAYEYAYAAILRRDDKDYIFRVK
ncbi:MAG: GNAT family N-acetyltransferase [Clostridia bacterium]|nr:GNAT family N-acetyltransferase [Clostridia bacterium]